MAHPIPKELKGMERLFTIPYINVHLNKKGSIYCGMATFVAVVISKLVSSLIVFGILFLALNMVAYPLAQMKTHKTKFEGGNVPLDVYWIRKFKYKRYKRNIYVRKRAK